MKKIIFTLAIASVAGVMLLGCNKDKISNNPTSKTEIVENTNNGELNSRTNDETKRIKAFMDSQDFITALNNLPSDWHAIKGLATVEKYLEGSATSVVVPIKKNGVIVAYIHGVRPTDESIMPKAGKPDYIVVVNDISKYNLTTQTGTILLIDGNINNPVALFSLNNGTIKEDLPVNTCLNCGWAQCYHAVSNACNADPLCHSLCDAANLAGGQCSLNMMIACVIYNSYA